MKKEESAVSEILGTMLLLLFAVSIFSVISIIVFSNVPQFNDPLVTITGTIEGNNVVITHRGGEKLSLESVIALNISGTQMNFTAEQLLDKESKQDGYWSVGERLIYYGTNFSGLQVETTVVDPNSEKTLLIGIFQHG